MCNVTDDDNDGENEPQLPALPGKDEEDEVKDDDDEEDEDEDDDNEDEEQEQEDEEDIEERDIDVEGEDLEEEEETDKWGKRKPKVISGKKGKGKDRKIKKKDVRKDNPVPCGRSSRVTTRSSNKKVS